MYNKLKTTFKNYIHIVEKLNKAGHEAYFVGGSLRDSLIGLEINDVDIATSATPEETMEVFQNYKIIPLGLEHGTVAIMIEGEQIEITTFRTDGEYSDGRRPDNVEFTSSLEEDLKRRDFTVNALAYNPHTGLVNCAGLADLENQIIRAVGCADERFQEDPLRILRGLRFSSKLGFTIEENTKKAIFANSHLLKNVSIERIQSEFNGILLGKNAKEILLEYSAIITEFIPEVEPMIGFNQNNPYHSLTLWGHTCEVVNNSKCELEHRLAAVFHDIGKVETYTWDENKEYARYIGHEKVSAIKAEAILRRLRYENKLINRVVNIIEDHMEGLSTKPYKIKKAIYELGLERFEDMLAFNKADDMSKNLEYSNKLYQYEVVENIAKEYLAGSPIFTHKDLDISAKELMELGIKGKELGELLNELALLVLSGHKNEKETQIEYVKRNILRENKVAQ